MRKRSAPHLWAPQTLRELPLLRPAQLDYGLRSQQPQWPQQKQRTLATDSTRRPVLGSCQSWERRCLGALVEQPLMPALLESQQDVGERYLARLWATHREHFGQSARAAPRLVLTDQLRRDTRGQYLPEQHLIAIRPSALTRHVLAHECCHAWTTQRHGPDFAAGMLYLMEHEFECDRAQLLSKARSLGLHIAAKVGIRG